MIIVGMLLVFFALPAILVAGAAVAFYDAIFGRDE